MNDKEKSSATTTRNHSICAYVCLSATVALINVFTIYPFIGLYDGFVRWSLALEIYNSGKIISDSMLSPIIPYMKCWSYSLTNSYAFFTYMQCLAFYLSAGLLTRFLCKRTIKVREYEIDVWLVIAASSILFIPTFGTFPLLLTDSSWVFCCVMSLSVSVYSLVRAGDLKNIEYAVLLPVVYVASFMSAGIRSNSVVLLFCMAVLIAIASLRLKKKCLILIVIALIAGGITAPVVNSALMPRRYNPISLGMIWELVSITARDGTNKKLKKSLSRFGDIKSAQSRYNDDFLNGIVWDENPPFPAHEIAKPERAKQIVDTYIGEIMNNPKGYFKMKLSFISRALGITKGLIGASRGIHDADKSFFSDATFLQAETRRDYISFTDRISFFSLRPIVLMVFVFALGTVGYMLRITIRRHMFVLFAACAYYSSFLINTQAHEFRYFAPSFFILALSSFVLIADIATVLAQKFYAKKKRDGPANTGISG